MDTAYLLAADIGGTNSRFAAFALEYGTLRHMQSVWLPTEQADSLAHLLEQLAQTHLPCTPQTAAGFVLGVAGPVDAGRRATLANIAWDIDLDALPPEYGCGQALLVNDFIAQAYACLSPAAAGTTVIQPGHPQPGAPIAIMGAGTGFGHALLVETAPGYHTAIPSEGGHANFPFIGQEEQAFADFLRAETGRRQVVGDMVVTGSGIRNLHTFFTGERVPSRTVTANLRADSKELEWFARFFGRACHDYVLKTLARGGLYLTGGVVAGAPTMVLHPAFLEEFHTCDRYADLLAAIPVRLNTNEEFGLWGAAQLAADRLLHSRSTA